MDKAHYSNSESDSEEEKFSEETKIDETTIKASDHSLSNQELNTGFLSAIESHRSVVVLIAILMVLVGYLVSSTYSQSGTTPLIREREDELLKYLGFLRSQYDHQDLKLWKVVGSQMAEYLNHSTAPLTIVMVYKEADKTAKLLASEVSRKAVELKHSADICGDSDSLKIEGTVSLIDGGYLLKEKLSSVSRCKKLLIFNVENLRPSAAADLHSLLDPDYPNVESAVYIFTVKIASDSDRSIYHSVGDLLKEQWGKELHADILEPLLSRLLNFVKIEPEPKIDF